MIPILLRDLAPRLLLLALLGLMFFSLEPGFHLHAGVDEAQARLESPQLSFTVANFTGVAMIVLLAGFISADRREGLYRIAFSHPTSPLALYGLRWVLALGVALLAGLVFLVVGQLAAWGEMRIGPEYLLHALAFALVYGGLLAFLSSLLTRGSSVLTLLIFFFTEFWHMAINSLGIQPFTPLGRQMVFFLLPPHAALTSVYEGVLMGAVDWVAVLFTAGYGLLWLALAGLMVRLREWP